MGLTADKPAGQWVLVQPGDEGTPQSGHFPLLLVGHDGNIILENLWC